MSTLPSFQIIFQNSLPQSLTRSPVVDPQHGRWETEPPANIAANTTSAAFQLINPGEYEQVLILNIELSVPTVSADTNGNFM